MILFLDIDGVLNDHTSNTIDRTCVHVLNQIIAATDCKIVLCSAWRYMILHGAMTLKGFEHLLRSHDCNGDLIGHTRQEKLTEDNRAGLVQEWLDQNSNPDYVILDDMDLGYTDAGMNLIQINGSTGLQRSDVQRVSEEIRRLYPHRRLNGDSD